MYAEKIEGSKRIKGGRSVLAENKPLNVENPVFKEVTKKRMAFKRAISKEYLGKCHLAAFAE